MPVRESKGERPDRRQWRIQGGKRVAVGDSHAAIGGINGVETNAES